MVYSMPSLQIFNQFELQSTSKYRIQSKSFSKINRKLNNHMFKQSAYTQIGSHSDRINNQKAISDSTDNDQNKNFKFISQNYSRHLACPICKELMIRPMRFHPCGHTFCLKCCEPFLELSKKFCLLQSCDIKCTHIQNDRTAQTLIDELKVKCTNEGCVYKGEYDNYKKTHKNVCIFKNGGISKWLSEIRGINTVIKKNIQENEEKVTSQPENQLRNQFRNNQRDIVTEQMQKNQYPIQFLEEQEKNNTVESKEVRDLTFESNHQEIEFVQKTTRIQQQSKSKTKKKTPNSNKTKNSKKSPKTVQNQLIKENGNQNNLIHEDNQSIASEFSRRTINRNDLIYDIPFGPSLEQQTTLNDIKKQTYIKKQVKKLQN